MGSWEEAQGGEGVAHERGRAQSGHARPDKRASIVWAASAREAETERDSNKALMRCEQRTCCYLFAWPVLCEFVCIRCSFHRRISSVKIPYVCQLGPLSPAARVLSLVSIACCRTGSLLHTVSPFAPPAGQHYRWLPTPQQAATPEGGQASIPGHDAGRGLSEGRCRNFASSRPRCHHSVNF